jgi:hypothetical protein
VANVLDSPADEVLAALAGAAPGRTVGDDRSFTLVRRWLDRAQSG